MIKPLDPRRIVEFILPRDTSEPPTIWKLRCLNKLQFAAVSDKAVCGRQATAGGDMEIAGRPGTVNRLLVRFGLTGVENFPGWADEPEIPGSNVRVPTAAFMDTIPDADFITLAAQIELLGTVTEDDAGKSSPPST